MPPKNKNYNVTEFHDLKTAYKRLYARIPIGIAIEIKPDSDSDRDSDRDRGSVTDVLQNVLS